jgi:hypothetical protein
VVDDRLAYMTILKKDLTKWKKYAILIV